MKNTSSQIGGCQKLQVDQMGEWDQKVQKSSYKINDDLVHNTVAYFKVAKTRQSILKVLIIR